MNSGLKKIAFIIGLGILGVSIFWSQDGFNFDIAGDAGFSTLAKGIGWFLAIAFSVLQFVFSSNFKELNTSLILLGLLAYTYSIYTNFMGITHFQGDNPNKIWSWALAFFLDASAEPLIAWSLGVGREGDFLGNIIKTISASFNGIFDSAKGTKTDTKPLFSPKSDEKRHEMPKFPTKQEERRENMPFSMINLDGERRKSKKHANISGLHGIKTEKNRMYHDE